MALGLHLGPKLHVFAHQGPTHPLHCAPGPQTHPSRPAKQHLFLTGIRILLLCCRPHRRHSQLHQAMEDEEAAPLLPALVETRLARYAACRLPPPGGCSMGLYYCWAAVTRPWPRALGGARSLVVRLGELLLMRSVALGMNLVYHAAVS